MTFVGTSQVDKNGLKELIKKHNTSKSYFFLRWVDKVKFCENIPDKLSPEGQLFNTELELRWKKKGDKFQVLLLSIKDTAPEFDPIQGTWKYQDRNAYIYPETVTRFPKGINTENIDTNKIGQRYFLDVDTSTIHFVALRIKK